MQPWIRFEDFDELPQWKTIFGIFTLCSKFSNSPPSCFFLSAFLEPHFDWKTCPEEFYSHHWITVDQFTSAQLGIINLLAQLFFKGKSTLFCIFVSQLSTEFFIFLFCNFCFHLFAYLWLMPFFFLMMYWLFLLCLWAYFMLILFFLFV